MFGLIIHNAPVSCNDKIKQLNVEETNKFVCTFENHLESFTPFCIFLTQPFSMDTLKGTIFGLNTSNTWEFLGILSNKSPNFFGYNIAFELVQIGIFIDAFNQSDIDMQPVPSNSKLISEKLVSILENLYNYSMSFEKIGLEYANVRTIPLKCFQDWYELTKKKLTIDPSWPKKQS